jgi:glutamate 5-kinase
MLHVDDGASAALAAGRSLLPAGVTAVDGQFERGDAVSLVDTRGLEVGRGLVAYAAEEARAIIGRQSAAIPEILGYRGREELIHRDDLVILGPRTGGST